MTNAVHWSLTTIEGECAYISFLMHIAQSLIISREGWVLTLSILPCFGGARTQSGLILSDVHLHASFPLLLPGVSDRPVVLRLQRLVVRQLHCGDQVLSEQLPREGSRW